MAMLDQEYKFIFIDVGGYGRNSDGGILEKRIWYINKKNGEFIKVPLN